LYILSELVPVTVVFITVLIFNISFTSGAVNGFILFSQILLSLNIDASGIITFPHQRLVTEGYQLLYGFLNLDFFSIDTMSFCLWPNATALDMLAFKYITIIYALSLVFLVIWFMNKCGGRCLGRWCRITTVKSSIIHGISAFLIICYSQSIMVSSSLLNGVELWRKINSTPPPSVPWRVWQNGNLLYFRRVHLLYALPALFCWLTIGILPPILLITYPLVNKVLAFFGCEESKLVYFVSRKLPISSLKPLLDSIQGCFKDNLRFFAGLYFTHRWTAPLVNAMTSSLGTAYIISEGLLIGMLALHALFQPYQRRVHNVIDTLLFMDLVLINSIAFYHYHLFQSQESGHTIKRNISVAAGFQMTLIYLPLLIVILYMLVIGCRRVYSLYSKNHRSQNQKETDINLKPGTQSFQRLRAAVRSISSLSGDISANEEELPHRIIAEVNYERFEDTDYAGEISTDNKSMQDIVTY
jgi:TRAP-type C4-dicarboxylate transport system permease small subunit